MKIPDAALQQHIAVLGKTGSGKTFAVKGIVERLLDEGRRVGIVDPTGAWWGLRSSRDGKGAGFPILVLGGDHCDLPLPALGGAAVARLLVEQGVNLVADTSALTVGERTRWFIDFANTVHRLNRAPLHLVLDEAHNFAPQGKVLDPDAGKMLHAANRLAAEGRSRGIRLAMITQRPQKLHKDTLTSADTLIAMRVLAPHDRMAVEDWIKGCGDPAQGKEVLNSLASLTRGEGWAWYPEGGFLQRMKFPAIRTFDSSATPTGAPLTAPKGAAEIDLTEIRAALADAVKEAEANDPKLLRAEIARLKREGEKKPAAERVEVPVIDHEAIAQAGEDGYRRGHAEALASAVEAVSALIPSYTPPAQRPQPRAAAAPARPKPAPRASTAPADTAGLAAAQRKILNALAFLEGVGIACPDKTQVSLFAGLSPTAGHTANMFGGLRAQALIDYPQSGRVVLTDAGRSKADPGEVPQTAEEMQQRLLGRVVAAQRKILTVLIAEYPNDIDKREASERAGLSPDAGHTANMYGGLRSLGLIDYPTPGRVVALPVLFLE